MSRCSTKISSSISDHLRLKYYFQPNFLSLCRLLSLMPILGGSVPPSVQPLYFKSLLELDRWTPGQANNRYDGILKFKSRKSNSISHSEKGRGKLLVRFTVHYLKDV